MGELQGKGGGVCAAGGRLLFTQLMGSSICPSTAQTQDSQDRIQLLNNAVNAESCEPISQAGLLWPFLYFQGGILFEDLHKGTAAWASFCIYRATFKTDPQRKLTCRSIFSK